jgi:hypothetical protein
MRGQINLCRRLGSSSKTKDKQLTLILEFPAHELQLWRTAQLLCSHDRLTTHSFNVRRT